ncbi:nitrite reductase small subunit NirD [Photobacterium sp. DNB22_13_2]
MEQKQAKWYTVCHRDALIKNAGVCVLWGHEQVAIFYCHRTDSLYAVDNYDPVGKANVLSRGILGSKGDDIVVASPLYKQHFNLLTGQCVELPEVNLKTFSVRCQGEDVQLSV